MDLNLVILMKIGGHFMTAHFFSIRPPYFLQRYIECLMSEFAEKTVLVTGASRGLGGAIL